MKSRAALNFGLSMADERRITQYRLSLTSQFRPFLRGVGYIVSMATIAMYTIYMTPIFQPTPGYLVWRLSMKLRTSVDTLLSPLNLTHAQYVVLSSLRGLTRGGQSPTQRGLADHAGLDPIYISKLVRTLETAKLVSRVKDQKDSRAVRLTVTKNGALLADRAIPLVHDMLTNFMLPLGGMDSKRARVFVSELETLLHNDAKEGQS